MKNKTVSVIVPVYNGEKYIERCLQSLFKQENIKIEIIVVNDGSTDCTLKILNKYKNIIKIVNIPNGGVSNARNIGIKISTGEYIGFVDCDDTVPSNYYFKLLDKITNTNSDIAICGMKKIFNDKTEKFDVEVKETNLTKSDFSKSFFTLNSNSLLMTVWNKLYKKNIIKNIMFDTSMVMGEDYEFNLNVYTMCNKFVTVKDCFYEYYQNSDSVTYNLKKKYSTAFELNQSVKYRKFTICKFKELGISKNDIENYMINRASMWFIKLIDNLFLKENPYSTMEQKKKIKEILSDNINKKYILKASNNPKNLLVKILYKINSVNLVYFIFMIKNL